MDMKFEIWSVQGILKNASGQPNIALGKTIDVAFSLEPQRRAERGCDPDYPVDWASDTAAPIVRVISSVFPNHHV